MKAPESYPKKTDLAKFGRVKQHELMEFKAMQQISHLDFDHKGENLLVVVILAAHLGHRVLAPVAP